MFYSLNTKTLEHYIYDLQNASAPDSSLPMMVALYMTVGMFTFVTPFLIHFVTKKYVTDIVYDPESDQYTASVFRFIPMKRKVGLLTTFICSS